MPLDDAGGEKPDKAIKKEPDGQNRPRHGSNNKKKASFPPKEKFVGACEGLTGTTFSMSKADDFASNLERLSTYVGTNYAHELGQCIRTRKPVVLASPSSSRSRSRRLREVHLAA
mmetsp:Transcript_18144/g.39618  ORF Transcript_18144/g.39618 Transcript_18144/m.39618 type:complete len:115 (-) Transcript_18144:801-1145(-)